ncbi:BglG family transcription antiterminator [Paraliobacillus salinarum]|uniref:BglG family transcription antiterminator n=1 Tax=Paraliobacillus salinarum TaxID=1158996 RepID=UPI0015F77FA5|nr:BglG family transcription antiterminator [Paraliobacillus salinarum]
MNTRLKQILQKLLNLNDSQTSTTLARALQVSPKTIRNDIKKLGTLLNNDIAYIESIRGKGYSLHITNEEKFKNFLQQNVDDSNNIVSTEHNDRVQYLIKRLLLHSSYIKIDQLAEELFISRTTLQTDLKKVRTIFCDFDLSLIHKPNYGVKVVGEEMKIRFCISENLFNQQYQELDETISGLEILPQSEVKVIRHSILNKLKKYKLIISDISLLNLITHISIACNRIRNNQAVKIYQDELTKITNNIEYTIAQEIVIEIEQKLHVSFSTNEIAYLAIHLQGSKKTHSESDIETAEIVLEQDIQQLAKQVVNEIDRVYSLNISDDKELLLALSLHLKPAINRYMYQMNLRNPLLEEIKSKYPFSFEVALTGAEVINNKLDISIDENEIGYMALHLETAMERQRKNNNHKKRCLLVCATGLGTAQLLSIKLENEFSHELKIIGTTEYYNLTKQPLDNIDLIISTIPIQEDLDIPIIEVSTILRSQDVNKIKKLIHNDFEVMNHYMREKFTYLKQEINSMEEAIEFLGQNLIKANMVEDNFINSVLERERYSPTSFGNLVAFPHAMEPQTNETFWSILTLSNPIQWGDNPVQIIYLLNISKHNKMDDLKPMYDVLMKLFENHTLLQNLLQCETYDTFRKTIAKY